MSIQKKLREKCNNGEISIFELRKDIKIVGTFHTLTGNDRLVLEKLVDESDFIALESSEDRVAYKARDIPRIDVKVKPLFKTSSFPEYVNLIDFFYLKIWDKVNESSNQKFSRLLGRNISKDYSNELEFCYRYATKKGKTVHFVDINTGIFFNELLKFSFLDKLKILSFHGSPYLGFEFKPDKYLDLLHNQREAYMFKELLSRRINQPKQKGALIVGYSHFLNYISKDDFYRNCTIEDLLKITKPLDEVIEIRKNIHKLHNACLDVLRGIE